LHSIEWVEERRVKGFLVWFWFPFFPSVLLISPKASRLMTIEDGRILLLFYLLVHFSADQVGGRLLRYFHSLILS
jgi:hypothetical protein